MKKNKIIYIFIIVISILAVGYFFIKDTNVEYEFSGSGNLFEIKGNAEFNKKENTINFTHFNALNNNLELSELKIKLMRKDTTEIITSKKITATTTNNTASSLVNSLTYSVVEEYGKNKIFNESVINNFDSIVYIEIEYLDLNNNPHSDTINLNITKK